jgi:hypothetical protein
MDEANFAELEKWANVRGLSVGRDGDKVTLSCGDVVGQRKAIEALGRKVENLLRDPVKAPEAAPGSSPPHDSPLADPVVAHPMMPAMPNVPLDNVDGRELAPGEYDPDDGS